MGATEIDSTLLPFFSFPHRLRGPWVIRTLLFANLSYTHLAHTCRVFHANTIRLSLASSNEFHSISQDLGS